MSSTTYVHILKDTLKKKIQVLDELITLSKLQEDYLSQEESDFEKFEEVMDKKGPLLSKLDELDVGFDKVYSRVREEVTKNKLQYKDEIIQLQEMIREITEKSVQIQSIEKMNKLKLEQKIGRKKSEVKEYKMNVSRANNYYKSMANAYQGESYFLDKKK